jgi:putative transposase
MAEDGKKSWVASKGKLSIARQCELLGINRTSIYYEAKKPSSEAIALEEHVKSRIDFWHTKHPYMGVRKIRDKLVKEDGIKIGRKLTQRYMEEIGVKAVYPKPNLSKPNKRHKKFPYLLRNKMIWIPNQVWAIDITYIKMGKSHMYLTAIIDWYSRFIVGWALSDTLDTAPVLDAVRQAIEAYGTPCIINSDQGSQFTSDDYVDLLRSRGIRQSMDSKGRWVDNVIIERWFRSLKCDNIYINEYATPRELRRGIKAYVGEYNYERPHQTFGSQYPSEVYMAAFAAAA